MLRWWIRGLLFALSFLLLSGIILFLIYRSEVGSNPNVKSIWDLVWWFLVTVSTVGYGDVVPKTVVGRVLGTVVILFGVAMFASIPGYVASYLVELRLKKREGMGKVSYRNHILILGKNRRVSQILSGLSGLIEGELQVVLVGDYSAEEVEDYGKKFPKLKLGFLKGDFTLESVLERASVKDASRVVILIPEGIGPEEAERQTLHGVLAVRSLNPAVHICVEALSDDAARHLIRAGATEVVIRDELSSFMLSGYAAYAGFCDFVRELASPEFPRLRVIPVPASLVGHTFRELSERMRKEKGVISIALLTVKKGMNIESLMTNDEAIDAIIKEVLSDFKIDFCGKDVYTVKINPSDEYILTRNDRFVLAVL